MTITATEQASATAVPSIVLAGTTTLEKTRAYKNLGVGDKKYLAQVLKNEHRSDGVWLITLPSGKRVILVKQEPAITHRASLRMVRRIVRFAMEERIGTVAIAVAEVQGESEGDTTSQIEVLATQAVMAGYEYRRFKTEPKKGWFSLKKIEFVTDGARKFKNAVAAGVIIGEETNATRELANTPGGSMTPQLLAEEAKVLGKRAGFSVKVLDVAAMEKLGMGGVIGVGKGSEVPPRFIIAEYWGAKKTEAPTVLIGKGVTFDTGGLNLKPSTGIYEMHMDMSGGAAVLHVVAVMARLGVERNVIALVPAVENMPSGASYRPGDQLKTMSGKTIEVLNTDAEGRVIMSDALTYAERYNPEQVIDVATLTGAAMVALGKRMSGLFTPDDELAEQLAEAGYRAGDYLWRMPLWEEFEGEVKGTFGDVANIGKNAPYGGAITAAVFLWQFAKAYRWAHIDIAPRMTSVDDECLAKGSVGASVQLLATFLRTP